MQNREDPDKAMEEVLSALMVAKAKPWPPIPVKVAGAEEVTTEAEAPVQSPHARYTSHILL